MNLKVDVIEGDGFTQLDDRVFQNRGDKTRQIAFSKICGASLRLSAFPRRPHQLGEEMNPTIVVDGEGDLGPWNIYLAVTTHDWRRCAVVTQEREGYHWEGFHPKRQKEIIEGRTLSSAARAKDAAVNWVQSEIDFLMGSGEEE